MTVKFHGSALTVDHHPFAKVRFSTEIMRKKQDAARNMYTFDEDDDDDDDSSLAMIF